MPTLAVTGGKGGTGKSTVAVNLAIALALHGHSLELLDLDVECPNDSRISGIPLQKVADVFKSIPVINDKCTGCGICVQNCEPKALYLLNSRANLVEDLCEGCMLCRYVCPFDAIESGKKKVGEISEGIAEFSSGKVRLLEGKLEIGEDASTLVIKEVLRRSKASVRIIDTAAGTHCTVVKALRHADYAFVVTEPTPFGIEDSRKVIAVLRELEIPFDLVLNRSGVAEYNGEIAPRFEIPYSRDIVDSYVNGKPVVLGKSRIGRVFMEMAEYAGRLLLGD